MALEAPSGEVRRGDGGGTVQTPFRSVKHTAASVNTDLGLFAGEARCIGDLVERAVEMKGETGLAVCLLMPHGVLGMKQFRGGGGDASTRPMFKAPGIGDIVLASVTLADMTGPVS